MNQAISWLAQVTGCPAPSLSLERLLAGRSNVTYRVLADGEPRWVLRTTPSGELLSTAHDLAREFRVQKALGGTSVPVPAVVAFREDLAGRPAYCMQFVAGPTVDSATALRSPEWSAAADKVVTSAARILGELHSLEPSEIGLEGYGRPAGYVRRQLDRWLGQAKAQSDSKQVFEELAEVYETLLGRVPDDVPAVLVHGDFHMANLILTPCGGVSAVLDWELSTLGHPLADFGTFLAYLDRDLWSWRLSGGRPEDDDLRQMSQIAAAYTKGVGFGEDDLSYFMAWAHWKIACIGVGVCARRGAGTAESGLEIHVPALAETIRRHVRAARELLAGAPLQGVLERTPR